MAIVFIGMAEVSSCEFTVSKGDKIIKGQEIGMFHFGGSSHCMLFRKETRIDFVQSLDTKLNYPVLSALAVASPAGT